jgi:hypothetical protein
MRTREIKKNALYDFKGVTCRVTKKLKDGRFLVRHHKVMHAVATGPQLKKIEDDKVRLYLRQAGVPV